MGIGWTGKRDLDYSMYLGCLQPGLTSLLPNAQCSQQAHNGIRWRANERRLSSGRLQPIYISLGNPDRRRGPIMFRRITHFWLLAAIAACTGRGIPDRHVPADRGQPEARCESVDQHGRCVLWGPSLVELISRPELYHGKRVRVIGFVNLEFEGNGLYLHEDDWRHSIYRNGIWIDPPQGIEPDSGGTNVPTNRQYVLVEGVFDTRNHGHMGMWSGRLHNVTRFEPWERHDAPVLVPGPPPQ
jgi:hypothetical protein